MRSWSKNPLLEFTAKNMTLDQATLYLNLKSKVVALCENDGLAFRERLVAFDRRLNMEHSGCSNFVLYHLISGGTLNGDVGHFDFPEPDSIKSFIEEEYEEVCSKNGSMIGCR